MLLLLLACTSPAVPAEPSPLSVRVDYDFVVAAADRLEFHQLGWTADGRSGFAWAVRVPRESALVVRPSDAIRPLADLTTADVGTWAAINGGFYEDGPMGLVVSEGVVHHPPSDRGGSGIVEFGPMPVTIVHRDQWTPGSGEALQSIDRIVDAGVALVKARDGAHRDARSAVAVSADGVWIVAAVAGESIRPATDGVQLVNTVGQGLTLAEFADLLVTGLHADQALNLDGAVSTQMIVSMPGWRWLLHGERGTINGVVVRPG